MYRPLKLTSSLSSVRDLEFQLLNSISAPTVVWAGGCETQHFCTWIKWLSCAFPGIHPFSSPRVSLACRRWGNCLLHIWKRETWLENVGNSSGQEIYMAGKTRKSEKWIGIRCCWGGKKGKKLKMGWTFDALIKNEWMWDKKARRIWGWKLCCGQKPFGHTTHARRAIILIDENAESSVTDELTIAAFWTCKRECKVNHTVRSSTGHFHRESVILNFNSLPQFPSI